YPTAITMPEGSILVVSGSFLNTAQAPQIVNNVQPQVWSQGNWSTTLNAFPDGTLDLFPRMHVASTGIVWLTSLVQTWTFDLASNSWTKVPNVTRRSGTRDYASSVLYDVDKIIFIGGGNAPATDAEIIDLSQAPPGWKETDGMHFPRRQHNATILADGTVLVTGGTRGTGPAGTAEGFNDLDPGHQRFTSLKFQAGAGSLTVTAPGTANICPPGHYMLFILNQQGVPSTAAIIQIEPSAAQAAVARSLQPQVLAAGAAAGI